MIGTTSGTGRLEGRRGTPEHTALYAKSATYCELPAFHQEATLAPPAPSSERTSVYADRRPKADRLLSTSFH
jgi:hypothetical protein